MSIVMVFLTKSCGAFSPQILQSWFPQFNLSKIHNYFLTPNYNFFNQFYLYFCDLLQTFSSNLTQITFDEIYKLIFLHFHNLTQNAQPPRQIHKFFQGSKVQNKILPTFSQIRNHMGTL